MNDGGSDPGSSEDGENWSDIDSVGFVGGWDIGFESKRKLTDVWGLESEQLEKWSWNGEDGRRWRVRGLSQEFCFRQFRFETSVKHLMEMSSKQFDKKSGVQGHDSG